MEVKGSARVDKIARNSANLWRDMSNLRKYAQIRDKLRGGHCYLDKSAKSAKFRKLELISSN
jgi:hypothetical protein